MTGLRTTQWPLMAMSPEQTGKPPLQVAMLTFPGSTLLDLVGPLTVLHGPMQTHLIWKTKGPVDADTGVHLHSTMAFSEAPDSFDILFVPGGPGQIDVFNDEDAMAFLAHHGARAKWVTSVCTGSLILGAAGLLKGYRAATHWAGRELLALFGAEPVAERIVIDRNRITGGGVTAGIDFGLTLLEQTYGADVAKTTQLLMEYDPEPPFCAGTVEQAGPEIAAKAFEVIAPAAERSMEAIGTRLGEQGQA